GSCYAYAWRVSYPAFLAAAPPTVVCPPSLHDALPIFIPTNENVLGLPDFDPMVGTCLTDISQADLVEQNLQFLPNRTVLTSAHLDRKSTRLNSSHVKISYAVFCLKKKIQHETK